MFFANTLISIAKAIQEQIEHEQTDTKSIQGKLIDLQLELEMQNISEEEYNIKEDELLKLLSQAQKKLKKNDD